MSPDLDRYPGFEREYLRMDVDYCGALLLTKGTAHWQYLFTDVSLRHERFEGIAAELTAMIDLFAQLFPHYDYTPLARRLEERL